MNYKISKSNTLKCFSYLKGSAYPQNIVSQLFLRADHYNVFVMILTKYSSRIIPKADFEISVFKFNCVAMYSN